MDTKKNGKFRGKQRYQCLNCGRQFSEQRKSKLAVRILHEYVWGKQTLSQISKEHQRSKNWIRSQIDKATVTKQIVSPQPIVAVVDSTFWGRTFGICAFKSPHLKRILYWAPIRTENGLVYWLGRQQLQRRGFEIKAVVADGKHCIKEVFKDLPVQMCHFHQIQIIRRYLTSNPNLPASKELKAAALTLPRTNEENFTAALSGWREKWSEFLKEKTFNPETKHWFYTHKRLRSAYRSLNVNLPHLFIYQKYPELNIPNTTNCLDGTFSHLKKLLNVHNGLKRAKKLKLIGEILSK